MLAKASFQNMANMEPFENFSGYIQIFICIKSKALPYQGGSSNIDVCSIADLVQPLH